MVLRSCPYDASRQRSKVGLCTAHRSSTSPRGFTRVLLCRLQQCTHSRRQRLGCRDRRRGQQLCDCERAWRHPASRPALYAVLADHSWLSRSLSQLAPPTARSPRTGLLLATPRHRLNSTASRRRSPRTCQLQFECCCAVNFIIARFSRWFHRALAGLLLTLTFCHVPL